MSTLLVLDRPERWDLDVPGVEVVAARDYLTNPRYSEIRRARVFNLCRSYRYQSAGYYVSLLATARGHVPRPSASTIRDMSSRTIFDVLGDDFDALVNRAFARIKGDKFELSVYFGRNTAKRYDRLALRLYNLFEAPLMRAVFRRRADGWQLTSVAPVPTSEIPDSHRATVAAFAREYFARKSGSRKRKSVSRYDLAILHDPANADPPTDPRGLANFIKAASELGMAAELITKDDYGRLAEFDALFIRETTNVDHYTYRFSRRATQLGLVVVDDPESIVRCSNKVFQAELLARSGVPSPKTLVVHKGNIDEVVAELGLPCVLKEPDGSYSTGVVKASTREEFEAAANAYLENSELVIAQEFLRTDFDWRIGIFEGQPLYACKYHMAKSHWQIMNWSTKRNRYGSVEALPLEDVPPVVVKTAVKAARPFGDGLYGVDLKHVGRRAMVIEVNDNPTIESYNEARFLGQELFSRVMQGFLRRLEQRARGDLRV
ncbi:MAG: RimK family protein [Planctomycetota bacterium]|nr:RimK family protein [Planctomycetota bacterium]